MFNSLLQSKHPVVNLYLPRCVSWARKFPSSIIVTVVGEQHSNGGFVSPHSEQGESEIERAWDEWTAIRMSINLFTYSISESERV